MVSRVELDLLLKTQQQCYNDTINHLVSSFKDQINKLSDELTGVRSELNLLRAEGESQKKAIVELSAKVYELETVVEGNRFDSKPVFERLDSLEDRSRRNNLRFSGIDEVPNENWEQSAEKIYKLVKDKLGVESTVEIERAHRVGIKNLGKPRTIVAKFLRFGDRQVILKNSSKLKGSGIFINEELCEASLVKRKNQLPDLKKAREEGKVAYFNHTRLVIRDRFTPRPEDPATVSATGENSAYGLRSTASALPKSQAGSGAQKSKSSKSSRSG